MDRQPEPTDVASAVRLQQGWVLESQRNVWYALRIELSKRRAGEPNIFRTLADKLLVR